MDSDLQMPSVDTFVKGVEHSKVYDAAMATPINRLHFLSKRLGHTVWIKREDRQPVYSFKLRGAYNCVAHLPEARRKHGIITASAGNHAQGVAFAGSHLGISTKIVMPATTPLIKVDSVRERGGDVVLHGDNFDQALKEAKRLEKSENRTFIHPYDDDLVIMGQGTIAMEILNQHTSPVDAIFVPVGGGGLLAGMAVYLKALRPEIKIYAVESEDSACLAKAMTDGVRTRLDRVGIFADGVAVAQIGERTFELIRNRIEGVITVTNDEICAAVKDIFVDTRAIAEPSGALSLAGLKKYTEQTDATGQNLMCVLSGANVDFSRLQLIAERTEIGEHAEGIYAVRIPENRGGLHAFLDVVDAHNISEFAYRYAGTDTADVLLGIRFRTPKGDHARVLHDITAKGYEVTDYTNDEIAKTHVMHMVGGHLPADAPNEYLFQVFFPERQGALAKFLETMLDRWNISLFHYRNLGSERGRVLIAFQCPEDERAELIKFLDDVEYEYDEFSDNAAYRQFLCIPQG